MAIYVVVGATKAGIGQAISTRLHDDGHTVFGTYELDGKDSALDFASKLPNLKLVGVDHGEVESLRSFLDSLPANIDGLAIAQMHFDLRRHDDFSEAEWSKSLAVNLTMPHFLTINAANKLSPGSCVVTVTSTEGLVGSFGAAGYAATKAAIHNLIKTHANTLGPKGIRSNAVAAGWIGGVMDTDEVFNMSRKITPLGRLGDASEIAAIVKFLLSSEASFVTGATIVADGGYSCVDTISKYEYATL